jgi:hypothetical protein
MAGCVADDPEKRFGEWMNERCIDNRIEEFFFK